MSVEAAMLSAEISEEFTFFVVREFLRCCFCREFFAKSFSWIFCAGISCGNAFWDQRIFVRFKNFRFSDLIYFCRRKIRWNEFADFSLENHCDFHAIEPPRPSRHCIELSPQHKPLIFINKSHLQGPIRLGGLGSRSFVTGRRTYLFPKYLATRQKGLQGGYGRV